MRTLGFGRGLSGLSLAGLAVLCLVYGNFAPIFAPFPAALPAHAGWAYGLGAILLAASLGLFLTRTVLGSAMVIGLYETVWVLARVRAAVHQPLTVASWYAVAEALGPLVGIWTLSALLRCGRPSASTALTSDGALRVAHILFGAACVAYGGAHFAYAAYTMPMVPTWLPARMIFVYVTGVAHAAAGVGLILGIRPRLAATLEALMLTLFGLLVWLPTFFAHPVPDWASPAQTRWSETFLNFLLAGAAWIVAASLGGDSRGGDRAIPD